MMVTGIQILLSIGLALIFFASAIPKLRHPKGFILAVLEYRVLPTGLSWFYARLLPPVEFLLALLLLTGTAVRSVAIILSLLLFSFMIAVGINLARGRTLDCHCFGKARRRTIGWGLLLQDGVLLIASLALAIIASAWIAPASWSIFRLSGLLPVGSPILVLGCVVVTLCAAALLGRPTFSKRGYGNGVLRR
jgi:methylamine utilization protein MauE